MVKNILPLKWFLLYFIIFISLGCTAERFAAPPKAVHGQIDLSTWDFSSHPRVELSGEWEFFANQLRDINLSGKFEYRQVPDHWSEKKAPQGNGRGAGTYRLSILLPKNTPDLGLRWWSFSNAAQIAVDGKLLAALGHPALDGKNARPAYRPGMAHIENIGSSVTITVQVSNFQYHNGGFWRNIELGTLNSISEKRLMDIATAIGLSAFFAAVGIIFSFFFFFQRKQLVFLFFTMLSFVLALRPLVIGDYFLANIIPSISYDLLLRLEYFTIYGSFLLAIIFLVYLFEKQKNQLLFVFLVIPSAVFLFIDFFGSISVLSLSLTSFIFTALIILILFMIFIWLPAFKKKELQAVIILVGTLFLIIAGIHDMLAAFSPALGFPLILWSFVAFIFLNAALLAYRFSHTMRQLEIHIKEKELLMFEVHHRVRNSLQIVISILSLKGRRSQDLSLKKAYASIQDRIRAISIAHEQLYRLGTSEFVELSAYSSELLKQMETSFQQSENNIALSFTSNKIEIPIGLCIDCGMILTELVGNSFIHMHKNEAVHIQVSIAQNYRKEIQLSVQDNGQGFPMNFELDSLKTFGFKMIQSIVNKYKGQITLKNKNGAWVEINLKNEQV